MTETNDNIIYVYKKGNTRFAYLNPLTNLEMALNQMQIADVIQNKNGIDWYIRVNKCVEELISLMDRSDRNEAIKWIDYVFQNLREEDDTVVGINIDLIGQLEQKEKVKRLNTKEKELLEEQYRLIKDDLYNETDLYGDMYQ